MITRIIPLGASIALASLAPVRADEFAAPLAALAEAELAAWATDPAVVAAVMESNAASAGLPQDRIEALDKGWRAEVGVTPAPMIDAVLGSPLSRTLRARREATGGLITEVFVMNDHGLNVAQSDVTSDYWQGDEDKFAMTYGAGPGAVHISEVELDESSQTYQSQVSLTIVDPATGAPAGAVTFGVDVSLLQ